MVEPLKVVTKQESWLEYVRTDVINMLEDLLARAKTGEITGIAVAATNADGSTTQMWSPMDDKDFQTLLKEVKFRLLQQGLDDITSL
jgi:hypothetical protein